MQKHFVARDPVMPSEPSVIPYKSINQFFKIVRVFYVQSNNILIMDFNEVRKSNFAFLIMKRNANSIPQCFN